jgi:hypothetical protein
MLSILHLLGTFVANLFKSRRRLEVENLFLRHQLNIALRHTPQRLRLHGSDRASLAWMTWLWPSLLGLARVVQPDTILRWHSCSFPIILNTYAGVRSVDVSYIRAARSLGASPRGIITTLWERRLHGWAERTRTSKRQFGEVLGTSAGFSCTAEAI